MYALRARSNPNALCTHSPHRPSCASPPPALTFVSISRSQATAAAAVGVGAPAVLGPTAPPQVRSPSAPTHAQTQFAVSTPRRLPRASPPPALTFVSFLRSQAAAGAAGGGVLASVHAGAIAPLQARSLSPPTHAQTHALHAISDGTLDSPSLRLHSSRSPCRCSPHQCTSMGRSSVCIKRTRSSLPHSRLH